MSYDLTIEENGFSPMDVDELLWVNGGSSKIENTTTTKTTTTTTTYKYDNNGRLVKEEVKTVEQTSVTNISVDSNKSIGQSIQNAWNMVKGFFSKK